MSSAITVGELLARAELEVTAVTGQTGLERVVTVPRIPNADDAGRSRIATTPR